MAAGGTRPVVVILPEVGLRVVVVDGDSRRVEQRRLLAVDGVGLRVARRRPQPRRVEVGVARLHPEWVAAVMVRPQVALAMARRLASPWEWVEWVEWAANASPLAAMEARSSSIT